MDFSPTWCGLQWGSELRKRLVFLLPPPPSRQQVWAFTGLSLSPKHCHWQRLAQVGAGHSCSAVLGERRPTFHNYPMDEPSPPSSLR